MRCGIGVFVSTGRRVQWSNDSGQATHEYPPPPSLPFPSLPFDSSEKTVAILGDSWWPRPVKQKGNKIINGKNK